MAGTTDGAHKAWITKRGGMPTAPTSAEVRKKMGEKSSEGLTPVSVGETPKPAKLTSSYILDNMIGIDTVSQKNGVFTARRSFFYKHGKDHMSFADAVADQLKSSGFKVSIIDSGEHDAPFRGGAPVAQQSHFWVRFRQLGV